MLLETTISVPEIMQTEEANLETLDEVPLLNPLSDSEMTVKEEIDQPVELAEKTNVLLNECMSTESISQFAALDDQHNFEDSAIEHRFNKPFDNIRQIHIPLPRDKILNNSTHECSSSNSTLSQSIASTTTSLSSQRKNEKERGRGKRRSRWKLKFHHQALPPEYLDHYEASMAQQEAAAAAAAAKSANIKSDCKTKGSGISTSKTSSSLSAKSSSVDKTDKLMSSSNQCFIKLEQEITKYDTQTSPGNTNVMDHLHLLPLQTLSINDDNGSNNKRQDETNIINEKGNLPTGKSHLNNERFFAGKGLLGSLLTSTVTSEISNRTANENERKRKSVIMSTSSSGNSTNSTLSKPPSPTSGTSNNNKVRNYQDLPYMGEITLDNMKPRRGRKPKKADICHLIYKNYGTTVFPGMPVKNNLIENEEWSKRKSSEVSQGLSTIQSLTHPDMRVKQENYSEPSLKCKPYESLKQCSVVSHSDVQNRIISSLLEKRLMTSQDGKKPMYNNVCFASNSSHFERNEDITVHNHDSWSENCKRTANVSDEPLNLCVKDLNQLKIRLLRKHGNFYEPRANDVIIKSEPPSPSNSQEIDVCEAQNENTPKPIEETGTLETTRSQMNPLLQRIESDNNCEPFTFPPTNCSRATTPTHVTEEPVPASSSSLPGGYIYWPSAGVFVHPMALQSQFLYYQKMGAIPLVPLSSAEPQTFMPSPVPHVNLISQLNTRLPQNSANTSPKSIQKKEVKSSINKALIPKAFSMMMDTSPKATSSIPSSEIPFSRLKRLAPLGNPPTTTAPTKRKRSAIFIPPMPSENSTNPTTEVSICKFKFTGGAKPSLQEKKMLSVDSGGNFRYYSGTGDKSMRGYEFFPRESLQQSGTAGGTSSEQFLAASAVASSDKLVGNTTLAFIPEENKSLHLHHLTGVTDQSSKMDTVNVLSADAEDGMGEGSSRSFEHQSQIGSVRKKVDFLMKERNASVSGESEHSASVCKEQDQSTNSQIRTRRKRKTRKSLAREKLEQTFKEKGFLIQTQQLESAEGATYCKFRQLRKFTRYLFRSWKDYLPGNVREMSVAAGVAGPETSPSSDVGHPESEVDGEQSCSNSPTPSIQHISESGKSFPSI